MNIKKHIPNAITCCNLLCGCLALVQAFEGNLVYAAYLVGMGAIFDFFDGFAARMLKVSSPIGKDLDSLTDMVTFGVVPGIVMYKLILKTVFFQDGISQASGNLYYLSYTAFLIPIFSAIRLAKFNNDARQSDSFIGLPTPANAIFICSIVVIYGLGIYNDRTLIFFRHIINGTSIGCANFIIEPANTIDNIAVVGYKLIFHPYILAAMSFGLSLLLVVELPLFALKFKHFKWTGNEIRFMFLGLSLVMLITLQFVGIPLIIIMYILLSVINNIISKKKVV